MDFLHSSSSRLGRCNGLIPLALQSGELGLRTADGTMEARVKKKTSKRKVISSRTEFLRLEN